jgi:gentisate 1,2-dioxygenase
MTEADMSDTAYSSSTEEQRQQFYARLDTQDLAPLWEVLRGLLPSEPRSKARPHSWNYAALRPMLLESGDLLTAEEAERRVLVLENPAMRGSSRATATIYAGIQLILPGETAPAHRHSPSALRFMMEGEGAITAVGGERTIMKKGDFVITPSWAWHDHGNEGFDPCAWLDVLDLPLVQFLEAGFNEHYNDSRQSITRPDGDSNARYGEGMVPLNAASPYGLTTPIFNYPYAKTKPALLAAANGSAPDPHEAVSLRYANPLDGGWAMPTISAWMVYLPAGFETKPMRTTDAQVMSLAEGRLQARFGDSEFTLSENDTAACPGWTWRRFRAETDCFLFCASDRVVHEKLGLYREERG